MSGLSVLKVLATVVDLFKMFNSTIGTFHHTTAHALQRSSLAGLRLLSRISNLFGFQSQLTQLAKIEVVRFWIGLIRLFIDWPQQGGRWISGPRTPKWAKNDY